MKRLSGKSRGTLKRASRRFNELPDARYVRAVTPAELGREFESFLEVEASGWKGRAGTAVSDVPRLAAFYRALTTTMARDGHCEVHALYADGRCIAAEFCVFTRRQCACLKSGRDEEYSAVSPGRLVVHKTIEWCCESPEIELVSEVSDAPWLRMWCPEENRLRTAYVGLQPLSGRLLMALLRFRFGPLRRWARALNRRNRPA